MKLYKCIMLDEFMPDWEECIVAVMETGGSGVNGQQSGIDYHLSVRRRGTYNTCRLQRQQNETKKLKNEK